MIGTEGCTSETQYSVGEMLYQSPSIENKKQPVPDDNRHKARKLITHDGDLVLCVPACRVVQRV